MKLNMLRQKNDTEDVLVSITKSCQTLVKLTQEKLRRLWNLKWPNQEKHIVGRILDDWFNNFRAF